MRRHLLTAAVLHIRGVRGAILAGILTAAIVAAIAGKIHYAGVIGFPHIETATAFAFLGPDRRRTKIRPRFRPPRVPRIRWAIRLSTALLPDGCWVNVYKVAAAGRTSCAVDSRRRCSWSSGRFPSSSGRTRPSRPRGDVQRVRAGLLALIPEYRPELPTVEVRPSAARNALESPWSRPDTEEAAKPRRRTGAIRLVTPPTGTPILG